MKNIGKRLTALMLTVIMFVSVLPINIFARNMGNVEVGEDGRYSMTLMWDRPARETWPANGTLIGYRIHYWNVSNGETINNSTIINYEGNAADPDNDQPFQRIGPIDLEPSSLYNFSVIPVYRFTNPIPSEPNPPDLADTNNPIAEFLFLTDISISAVGETDENSITVNWKIPTLQGSQQFFTHYDIRFSIIQHDQTLTWQPTVRVPAEDLAITPDGMASYTISNALIIPGNVYAIEVDPVFNNMPSSGSLQENAITIGGKPYFFSRSPHPYIYDRAHVRPPLNLSVEDLNNLILQWEASGVTSIRERIRGLEIFRSEKTPSGADGERSLAFLSGASAHQTDNWVTPIPEEELTRYWFEVRYADITYIGYNNEPVVIRDLKVRSLDAVYDPALVEFTPYRPNIYEITDNREEPFTMDITWEAFLRSPLSAQEIPDPIFNGYLDTDLTYRMWITDNRNNFNNIPDNMVIEFDANDLEVSNINGSPYYSTMVDSYVRRDVNGFFVEEPLQENAVYYVKIEAIRNINDQVSQPAYGAHFIIPINVIPTEPSMLSRPPLRIKNIDGVDQITQTSITIEWEEQWFEVYDEGTGKWHSAVGIQNGNLVFGDSVTHSNNILMNLRALNPDGSLNVPVTRERIITELSNYTTIPVIRMIDLTNSNYQLHTAEFEAIEGIGFEEYLNSINSPNTTETWTNIAPTGVGTLEHVVSTAENPAGPMLPATAYAMFIRPYEASPDGDRMAIYPNYISATTLSEREDLEIIPIVPILHPVRSGGTYLVVRWEYIPGLQYELRYSENRNDYSEGGILIEPSIIAEDGNIVTIDGKQYIEFTIPNLFPETPHHIWVRSRVGSNGGERVSNWSNPIEMQTGRLQAPNAPRGLGIASTNHVNMYNRENGTEYTPLGPNHIIVEWLRHPGDDRDITTASGSLNDLAQPLYLDDVDNIYMLRFNDLVANRRYYVRVKTRLVISRGPGNTALQEYTYVAQLSLTEDFLDVIEIEMPTTTDTSNARYIDSEWSQISIFSDKTDDEYDGDVDPNTVPLPDRDFEILYDSSTNTLTHRFRSNQVDADGNRDNNVDQRFISRLVENRTFVYEVDVSTYGSRTVQNRVVEVPFSIIEAFDERQIDLRIKAGNLTLTIPHNSLITKEVRALPGLNRETRVLITLSEESPGVGTNQRFSTPQRLNVQFIEGVNSVSVTQFNKGLNVDMDIPLGHNTTTHNINGNIKHENTGGWQMLNSSYDQSTNSVKFVVNEAGSYTVISSPAAQNVGTSETLPHMQRVNSKLHITDMTMYQESNSIHANQFNQIVAAIAQDQKSVQMNAPLSNDTFVALGRSGMLVSGETVSRQTGITSLVRLYEVKTGYPITMYPSISETSFTDISSADEQYQVGLLKASSLGFFRGPTANPQGNLTMGDLMFILDIILA